MAADRIRQATLDALTLLALPRVGIRGWHRRVAEHHSATNAIAVMPDSAELDAARAFASASLHTSEQLGAQCIVFGTHEYPALLHDLSVADSHDLTPAPPVLFAKGNCELLARPAIAMVGTRHATVTGLRVAERIARECAEAGAVVVSGLARGIDAAAHTGALGATGATIAVIGTGIDVVYPAEHRGLQARIAREGLLLSELPPSQRATRGSFPERNRLIAALSKVTVVIEAGHRSGALLTAKAAESLNRTSAAVPGTFDAAACLGSNALLRDGAQVISCVDDALTLLGIGRVDDRRAVTPVGMTDAERAVWDVIGNAPLELDLVMERSGWAADACLAAVTTLELRGLVRATYAGALHRA